MNNEHYSIVVVDHDPVNGPATISALQAAGFECSLMNDADLALKEIAVIKPHLVLMDLVMPVFDGIDICIELRKISDLNNLLIVFYSERAEDYSQIAAFNAGADDYIIRPVKSRVLVTRLKAILKRYATSGSDPLSPKPGLLIDRERYLITMDGEEIILPRKEFELLALLFSSPRKVFTRKEISQLIWGYEFFSRNRTIDVHIRKLREKLGEKYIKTIKGIGYSLEL
jgi:two-component system alkaline phosphatase synthesis response regulator PhoP